MKKWIVSLSVAVGSIVALVPFLRSQNPPKLAWEEVATNLAEAQSFSYKYYVDGSTAGSPLPTVTCTGTASPFTCTSAVPTLSPGRHTVNLTASSADGESSASNSVTFTLPQTPQNLRKQ